MAKKLSKAEEAAAEKERMKKQLMLLGGLMVMVVLVNRKSIMKAMGMGGKSSKGRRGRRVNRRAPAGRAPAAQARAPARQSSNRAALTPSMIPTLDEATKRKLHQIGKPSEIIPEEDIRYDTRNPFVDLSLDDRQIIKKQDEKVKRMLLGAQGLGGSAPDDGSAPVTSAVAMFFRGVIPKSGSRYAILQTALQTAPVREGDQVPGTDWILLAIGPMDAFVILHNPQAKRAREKITVVHRDGVKPQDLADAENMFSMAAGVDVSKTERRRGESSNIPAIALAMLETQNGAPAGGGVPLEEVPEEKPAEEADPFEEAGGFDDGGTAAEVEDDDGFGFFDE